MRFLLIWLTAVKIRVLAAVDNVVGLDARLAQEAERLEEVRADPERLRGLREIGGELVEADRPGGQAEIGPCLVVHRVVRPAEARPMVGGAAEEAQPAGQQVVVGQSDIAACVERLGRALEREAPRFHQQHLDAGGAESPRERDPRGAGPEDADRRREFGADLVRARVERFHALSRRLMSYPSGTEHSVDRPGNLRPRQKDALEREVRPAR